MLKMLAILMVSMFFAGPAFAAAKEAKVQDSKIYTFTMKDIDGKELSLAHYKGKVLLVVNVASQCGNTPQYKPLEETYQKYHAKGFEILGFPANEFGHQEPGSDKEIKDFCDLNYHVTFPMFSKIVVKGDGINPLYQYLTTETDFKGEIGWNFAKFLVDRQGHVIARYSPKTQPEDKQVIADIEKALAEK
jgi:glutathione peroxidase